MDQIWPESLRHTQLNLGSHRKQNTLKLPTQLMILSRNQRRAEEPLATVTASVTKAEEPPLARCLAVTELPLQLTANPDMILLLAEALEDSPGTWRSLMKIEIEKKFDQIVNFFNTQNSIIIKKQCELFLIIKK